MLNLTATLEDALDATRKFAKDKDLVVRQVESVLPPLTSAATEPTSPSTSAPSVASSTTAVAAALIVLRAAAI